MVLCASAVCFFSPAHTVSPTPKHSCHHGASSRTSEFFAAARRFSLGNACSFHQSVVRASEYALGVDCDFPASPHCLPTLHSLSMVGGFHGFPAHPCASKSTTLDAQFWSTEHPMHTCWSPEEVIKKVRCHSPTKNSNDDFADAFRAFVESSPRDTHSEKRCLLVCAALILVPRSWPMLRFFNHEERS